MAAKKSEIKSEMESGIKSGKKSTSSTPKVSRKKAAVQVEAVSQVVAAPVAAAAVVAAPVAVAAVAVAPVAVAPVAVAAVDEALVRARAHAIFEQHGGSAFDNWLRAERESGASAGGLRASFACVGA